MALRHHRWTYSMDNGRTSKDGILAASEKNRPGPSRGSAGDRPLQELFDEVWKHAALPRVIWLIDPIEDLDENIRAAIGPGDPEGS